MPELMVYGELRPHCEQKRLKKSGGLIITVSVGSLVMADTSAAEPAGTGKDAMVGPLVGLKSKCFPSG